MVPCSATSARIRLLPPHHRVQAVHGLIQNQYLRPGAEGQLEGRLLLHALGEPANGALRGQLEDVIQPLE